MTSLFPQPPTDPALRVSGRVGRPPLSSVPAVLLFAGLVAGLMAGCAQKPDDVPTPSNGGNPSRTETAVPQHSDAVQAAVADLADRLTIDENDIDVVRTQEVTWRDGSIGCAEKGMSYTQAIVPGLRITLRVDGDEHEYHQARNKAPFLCEKPTQ